MTAPTIRAWRLVHTWTSLICTVFLLMLCITGLPLIFSHEIDAVLKPEAPFAPAPAGAHAPMDPMLAKARAAYPGETVRTVFLDDDAPQVGLTITPATDGDFKGYHQMFFDARTGEPRLDSKRDRPGVDVTGFLLTLHTNMFAGLLGELFLGVMGILFVASLVSGAVLYAPFMRKLDFGAVRKGGSGRLAWLDTHNLLGVVALAWMLVVGATGAMNSFSTPIFGLWQMTEVAPILKPYAGKPPVRPTADLSKAVKAAEAAVPGMTFDYLTMPAHSFASPVHYVVWLKGDRTLTSRMLTPVLVNATTGAVERVAAMPWYLKALEISRPLHFGDYGGLPLKVLWGLLDAFSIVVLVTGVYLWVVKKRWRLKSADLIAAEVAAGAPA